MTDQLDPRRVTRRTVVAGAGVAVALSSVLGSRLSALAQDASPDASPAASPVASPMAGVAPSTGPTPSLKIGLIPAESSEEMLENFAPLTDYIKERLEVEDQEVFVGTDYSGVIEAMRSGELDVALYGPFSYVLGSQIANAKSLVTPGNDAGEPSTYNSLILANASSGITTLDGLKGHTFSFVDPASTSGNLIPRGILLSNGINPDADMESIFAGGHDASLLAIGEGRVDAGAASEPTYNKMVEEGVIDPANYTLIVRSDPIPEGPIAYRGDLDPALVARLDEALLHFHEIVTDPAVLAIVIENGTRLVPAPDSLYDGLRVLAESLGLTPEDL